MKRNQAMTNKISVIIPIYNVEKFLPKCIESIISQSYKNLEILLVDDGSTDNCNKICKQYAKKDNRIKLFKKNNGGLSDARNYGIDRATGDYLFFVDSDDYIAPNCIKELLDSSIAANSEIATTLFVAFHNGETPTSQKGIYKTLGTKDALENLLYQKNCTTSAWGKLYKKELFNNIRYPKGKICEDLPTTYKLFAKASKISIGTSKLYFYLQRQNSIIISNFKPERFDALEFAKEETQFIEKNYPSLRKAAANRELMEAIYILESMKPNCPYRHEKQSAIRTVKDNRKTILFDKKAPFKTKVYAIVSYIGIIRAITIKKTFKKGVAYVR